MWRIANRGERQFKADARYDLKCVTAGFASHLEDPSDDTALLERICTAYAKAVKQQAFEPATYRATGWWEEMRQRSLRPVMHALMNRDIDALRTMYQNFFRDPCSTGLVGAPFGMSKNYSGKAMRNLHRRYYLSDVLYSIDHWTAETGGRFRVRDLAGPKIGNPFGALIEGTLVEAGAEYRHYCAQKLSSLLDSDSATIAEIGGGFGGMAYYLLRDRPGITYLDFDVPESIALAGYYLMKALPRSRFLLYGEGEPTQERIGESDVVLLPVFELSRLPTSSVDVSFSSHALSDLSTEALENYLDDVARMTRRFFLHVGIDRPGHSISDVVNRRHKSFEMAEMRAPGWHSHKMSSESEVEYLYCVRGL